MARKIEVEITGDARSLETALGKSTKSTESFGGKLAKLGGTAALVGGAAGLGALAFGLKTGIEEFGEASRVAAQTDAVLKSTGGAAGVTAAHVGELASKMSDLSGADDEAIQSGENLLLTFTNVQNKAGEGNDIFDQATQVMTDMSVALGKDASSSAIGLGKALNDPIKGVTALQRVGVSFTADQKEQIKTLVEHGKTVEAQKLILAELTKEFGGSAKAAGDTFPGQLNKLKETFNNLAGEVVGSMVPALQRLVEKVVENLPHLRELASAFIDRIKPAFSAVWQFAKDNLIPIFTSVKETFTTVVTNIARVITEHKDDILSVWRNLKSIFGDVVDILNVTLVPLLKVVFEKVLPKAIGIAIPVIKTLSDAFKVLADVIKAIVDGVKWLVENIGGLLNKIPGVHIGEGGGGGGRSTQSAGGDGMLSFHTGGVVDFGPGRSEGPAYLRQGEVVLTPEQASAMGGGWGMNVKVYGQVAPDFSSGRFRELWRREELLLVAR